ncbi:MAG: SRPBCC family protein [Gaiellaceae bacterium]
MEPLELKFAVDASAEHAFELWATKIDLWWPRGHTVSREPGLTVTFEPRSGGRIYERTPSGEEHEWGEVVIWEPPTRLAYLWHLMFDRRDATEVEVTFTPEGGKTTVTIEHRGWERLGADGAIRRDRTRHGWGAIVPSYQAAVGRSI